MKNGKTLVILVVALLIVALSRVAVGQAKATAQEVVAKVREAASTLSKTGDVAQFNQKQGPWVWKDTYMRQEHLPGPGSPLRWSEEAFRRLDRVSVDEAGREEGLPQDQLLLECQRNPVRGGRRRL